MTLSLPVETRFQHIRVNQNRQLLKVHCLAKDRVSGIRREIHTYVSSCNKRSTRDAQQKRCWKSRKRAKTMLVCSSHSTLPLDLAEAKRQTTGATKTIKSYLKFYNNWCCTHTQAHAKPVCAQVSGKNQRKQTMVHATTASSYLQAESPRKCESNLTTVNNWQSLLRLQLQYSGHADDGALMQQMQHSRCTFKVLPALEKHPLGAHSEPRQGSFNCGSARLTHEIDATCSCNSGRGTVWHWHATSPLLLCTCGWEAANTFALSFTHCLCFSIIWNFLQFECVNCISKMRAKMLALMRHNWCTKRVLFRFHYACSRLNTDLINKLCVCVCIFQIRLDGSLAGNGMGEIQIHVP